MDERTTELMFSTGQDEQETPDSLFESQYLAQDRFIIDVAATFGNAKFDAYFGPDHKDPSRRDCLAIDWPRYYENGGSCWMNPPYSDCEFQCRPNCKKKRCPKRGFCLTEYKPGCIDFVKKAYDEAGKGSRVVALLAARTDTEWFHEYIYNKNSVRYELLRGRLKFNHAKNSAPFPSMLVWFYPRIAV
jgi:hypothetical protein